ncbi:RNA polymerase II mediator complex subunit [Trapelia coarctata]|nr:RNA polymerase II mediator complex subunit [Trapelia coarctata]
MADRLTQLQDCLDQVQPSLHPSPSPLPPLLPQTPNHTHPANHPQASNPILRLPPLHNNAPPLRLPPWRPPSPPTFSAAIKELAHDLVLKQQQIEAIINSLPAIEKSEEEQVARIRELDVEVRAMEAERVGVLAMKEELLARVEGVIGRVSVGRG